MADSTVKTKSEFVVLYGENLPNHSQSMLGRGKYVRINGYGPNNSIPLVRTRQEAYRLAANLIATAQELPDEDVASTWDEVIGAVTEERSIELDMVLEDGEELDDA